MKLRIYIDTSVIGGCFDEEFEYESNWIINKIREGKIKAVYSEITEQELISEPNNIKELVKSLPKRDIEFVKITEESAQLADTYILEQIVGKTCRVDCLHITLATINRVDILVSWNFKHIVNINRIRGYNSVNMKLGYPTIDIRSP